MQEKRNREEERDCMSLEGFCRYMKICIQQRLGEGFQTEVQEVTKNNNVKLQGLVIQKKGSNLSPNIYLDDYYHDYTEGKYTLDEAEQKLLECYHESRPIRDFPAHEFMDWETAKQKIVCRLISYESNQELLEEVPHRRFLDLAIVPYYLFGFTTECSATILIHHNHLEMWDVEEQELLEVAWENTQRLLPHSLQHIEELIKDILGEMGEYKKEMSHIPMYVLTNNLKLNGAVCMFYTDVLKNVAEQLDADLYILPSSLHEVLLLPADGSRDKQMLCEMVEDVNTNQLREEDVLSESVYFYSRKTGKITIAE